MSGQGCEMTYLDFDLLIQTSEAGYRAMVLHSPAGQAATDFVLPFAERGMDDLVTDIESAKDFGRQLFDAAFGGQVQSCLHRSLDEANRQNAGLRIRLRLTEVPELASLPWEYLYDPVFNRFLVLSTETPLLRYLDLPERIQPLAVEPPLKMLVVIASPRDLPSLNVEREWETLCEALDPLLQRGLVTLERLDEPSLAALQRQLRKDEYPILHFIGHGSFDERAQDGMLILEDGQGRGHPVSGRHLGVILHDHRPLRLVFLNACEGARTRPSDAFAGVAQSLVQQGIPAVVAMQSAITDSAAITLVREFYGALADGYPVDADLAEARKAVFALPSEGVPHGTGPGQNVEWGTPVLYMRSPDGRIFDVERAPPPSPAQVGQALIALADLMQVPQVRDAVVAFRTDFEAACEQINTLGNYKRLHDLFQELENLHTIVESICKRLATDQMAWEGIMLHEPEIQGVMDSLLKVADRATPVIRSARWPQRLDQVRKDLRTAVENLDANHLEKVVGYLRRVLDREPSRINTCLVQAAGALRLADLANAMATVRDRLAQRVGEPPPEQAPANLSAETARQFASSVDALIELDASLTTLVSDHNRWQEIDDELRRVETGMVHDLVELELSWPDIQSMGQGLFGDRTAEWATSLVQVGARLEAALDAGDLVRVKMFFLRYRSQAGRRFHQVDSDLLALCQDLQKIGESLDLLLRTVQ